MACLTDKTLAAEPASCSPSLSSEDVSDEHSGQMTVVKLLLWTSLLELIFNCSPVKKCLLSFLSKTTFFLFLSWVLWLYPALTLSEDAAHILESVD